MTKQTINLLALCLIVALFGCSSSAPQAQAAKDAALFGCGVAQTANPAEVSRVTGVSEERIIQLQELCITADRISKAWPGTAGAAGAAGSP